MFLAAGIDYRARDWKNVMHAGATEVSAMRVVH